MIAGMYDRLSTIFEEVFEYDGPVTEATVASDVEGWDSMGHIRLMITVEDSFGISFSASEVGGLKNVGELARLIESKVG